MVKVTDVARFFQVFFFLLKANYMCSDFDLYKLEIFMFQLGGARWRSLQRHCATSRKVAVSIPDGIIWMFCCLNPSRRPMALGPTQPLRKMNTRNIFTFTFMLKLSQTLRPNS